MTFPIRLRLVPLERACHETRVERALSKVWEREWEAVVRALHDDLWKDAGDGLQYLDLEPTGG